MEGGSARKKNCAYTFYFESHGWQIQPHGRSYGRIYLVGTESCGSDIIISFISSIFVLSWLSGVLNLRKIKYIIDDDCDFCLLNAGSARIHHAESTG